MHRVFFGDLHNHNSLGYGFGSLERSIDVAGEHLDFFAFTGHSSWHDIHPMEGGREAHWTRGFEVLAEAWPDVLRMTREANQHDDFVAFLGFEWHSSEFGDQCVIFPDDEGEIAYANDIRELRSYCLDRQALMIPHHLAYPKGSRGVNWDVFTPDCTPFVEIFSEHGNSEEDRGPYPFFNHSLGGRVTSNTVRAALGRGLRFGFSAGSDDHRGFPGGYGEGVMGVLSDRLTRSALLDAMRRRRVYGTTGERIEILFEVDGHPMGSDLVAQGSALVQFEVSGRDALDVVEIIQDGAIVHRAYPTSASVASASSWQIRVEWGWGPWMDLTLERIADWSFRIEVEKGAITRRFPCIQSGPFDEARRHRIRPVGESAVDVVSYTSRRGAYRGNPNNSVVLEIEGDLDTVVALDVQNPGATSASFGFAELMESSRMLFIGPFPAEGLLVHRPVHFHESTISGETRIKVPDGSTNVYLRARQMNGQIAWSSPVFIDSK